MFKSMILFWTNITVGWYDICSFLTNFLSVIITNREPRLNCSTYLLYGFSKIFYLTVKIVQIQSKNFKRTTLYEFLNCTKFQDSCFFVFSKVCSRSRYMISMSDKTHLQSFGYIHWRNILAHWGSRHLLPISQRPPWLVRCTLRP